MNRIHFSIAVLLGALTPLVFDSALKGAALLAVAALTALALWRASAAARHLVWLVAVVALLVVPVLSVALPQWRVLPKWAAAAVEPSVPGEGAENKSYRTNTTYPPQPATQLAQPPLEVAAAPSPGPAAATHAAPVALRTATPAKPKPARSFRDWLPLVWSIGFALLALRLFAAHLLLRRAARVCANLTAPPDEFIAATFAAACEQLGVKQRVTLLLDERRTIPVVWGVFRPRLLLPVEARTWSEEQLLSVLLHELAHIRRRDTLVQWLTQTACALHWWNPLVWLAAWRLHVERERACDDLVLASGVRPSAYAEHLLDVATKLSPARWTSACGLAMARQSSLEGRLVAVLSEKLNRRSVTSALAGIALLLGAGIAIPIAMLRAADENVRDGTEYNTDKGSAWVRNENGKAAYIIFAPFKWSLRVSGYHRSDIPEWVESCEITLANGEVADLRIENPAPKELTYRKETYDFTKGRVFLANPDGSVRQLDIAAPVITDQDGAAKFAKLIAAIPPQTQEKPATPVPMSNRTGKLQPATIAKLKWGEPVNGLRMALAFPPALKDALLGEDEFFQLIVQNVSEKEVRFTAGDDAPNPRSMQWREGERIVQILSDEGAQKADWKLSPGECGLLWMFTKEERNKDGQTISALLDKDLAGSTRSHVVGTMEIAKAPAGAASGELVTGPTRGSTDKADAPAPMHTDARALYEIWQRHARANGDIPGALIGELAAAVKVFIGYNPTWETVRV